MQIPGVPSSGAAVDRRGILRAGAAGGASLGIGSLVLPSSAAASSVSQVQVSGDSLLVHLDAALPGSTPATVWQDLSGSGNPGTVGASVTHVVAAGAVPAHYSFPAGAASADLTEVVNVRDGDPVVNAGPAGFTRMIWYRRDRVDAPDNLISSTGATGHADHFLFFRNAIPNPNARLTTGHNGNFGRIRDTAVTTAGVWTFGAATFSEAAGFALYTNTDDRDWSSTASVSSSAYAAATDSLGTAPMSFQIGGYAGGQVRFRGDIATVVIHARALAASEVEAYYAATVDRFHPV